MGRLIGIDLGTTYSAAAVLDDGNPFVIEMKNGKRSIPSVVGFKDEEIVVGDTALNQDFVLNSVKRIKRKMGTDFKVKYHDTEYTPEEISAFILKEIKEQAEETLGDTVTDAIITVPAYFNDNQRHATKNAGKIAGLNVLRIINEPTAASLAYGVKPEDDLNIVVYDLGGGTFDVSVLNVGEGIFEVIATAGDNNLGGEDFNERIVELVITKFKDETDIDLSTDPLAMTKIYDKAEKCKRELSDRGSTRFSIPFITADESGPRNIDFEITREEFEKMISDYIKRTIELTEQAVKDGNMEIADIDRIILVGGSTRIPYVRETVKSLFGRKIDFDINPEDVVAMGAVIQGGIVQGDISGIVLVDVTPISLGIEVENGYFVPIIERNTPIPTSAKRIFTTVGDKQKSVDVHILQGESMYCDNNISLGKFRLEGIRPTLKGEPRIEVTFELDVNGILNVTAVDLDSECMQGITIINQSRLSEDELEKMKEKHYKNYEGEIKKRKKLDKALRMKTKTDNLAARIENSIPPAYRNSLVKQEIAEILDKAEQALQSLCIEDLEKCIKNLEFIHKELKAGSYTGGERIA